MTDTQSDDSTDPTPDDDGGEYAARPIKTTGTRGGPVKDYDYHVLANTAQIKDLRYGVRYYATINNVKGYGVFVSLNDDNEVGDDISGLVHENNIPNMYTPSDFRPGDTVGVMLYNVREDNLDLSFEMVAVINSHGQADQFENDPLNAPGPDLAPAFNRDFLTETLPDDDSDDAESASDDADAAPDDAEQVQGDDADTDADHDAADGDESDTAGGTSSDVIDAVAQAVADELQHDFDAVSGSVGRAHGDLRRQINDAIAAIDQRTPDPDAVAATDQPRTPDPAAVDEWPGRYGTVVALLRASAREDYVVERVDYDDNGDTRTLSVEVRADE